VKTTKPLRLSLLVRPFRYKGQDYLGISILGLISLDPQPRLKGEQDLWQLAEKELNSQGLIDQSIPKFLPEFLVSGAIHTHHQADKTACLGRVRVGNLEKNIIAFGDRFWKGGKPTEPAHFEKMLVDWAHAYGGAMYAKNPLGRGAEEEIIEGNRVRRLPNIESWHGRIQSPDQKVEPTSLGMIDITWPQRFSKMGHYDGKWLKERLPGFADDIDWRMFNAAPEDQQWPELDRLPAGAEYEIWNMHPEKHCLKGRLPDWHARCFVNRKRKGEEVFEEVPPLRLTTAWFVPHLEQAILIWHGSTEAIEDDAADILHIMPAIELPGQGKDIAYYREIWRQRIDPEKGALYALRDKDLLPESILGPWLDDDLLKDDSPMRRNMKAHAENLRETERTRVAQMGLNPDDYLPPSPPEEPLPKLDDLPEFMAQMEKKKEEAMQKLVEAKKDMETQKAEALKKAAEAGMDTSVLENPSLPKGPPTFRASDELARVRDSLGPNPDQAAAGVLDDPKMQKLFQDSEENQRKMYRMSAQFQEAADRLLPEQAQKIRNQVKEIYASTRDFSGMDLTGADLSEMNLEGANFREALLESADLSRARLDGADFSGAVLVRTQLTEASFNDAKFKETNLSLAKGKKTSFAGAQFDNTTMLDALFEQCNFTGTHCSQLQLIKIPQTPKEEWMPDTEINLPNEGVRFTECWFNGAMLDNVVLMGASLQRVSFDNAMFRKSIFLQCEFEKVSFSEATFDSGAFVETQADETNFSDAVLISVAFAKETSLNHADFSRAKLVQCNFRQIPLMDARFHGARLETTDMSEAILKGADLREISAPGSMFIRSDLTGAKLNNADLIQTILQKAIFVDADLRGGNLFQADVSQSLMDKSTLMDGTFKKRMKIYPLRKKNAEQA
jgi:uncharacterized protein YjbI with pentapeptide repeats